MAQVTKVRLVDDLDGGEADESVRFAIDGRGLEIDLSKDNADKLREILAPYIAAARRGGPAPRRQQRMSTSAQRGEDTGAVRAWAVANGFTVSARGRISSEVMAAYRGRDTEERKPALPTVGDPFQVNAG